MPVIPHSSVRRDSAKPNDPLGPYEALRYSDTGGLTQFGALIEVLPPGSKSSNRHWHEAQDEFLYMIEGEATLIENRGTSPLRPGDAVAWPKGAPNGHCVENRSTAPIRYLIAGTRGGADVVHYPDLGEQKAIAMDGTRTVTPDTHPAPADHPTSKLDLTSAPHKTGSIYPEPYASMMDGRSSLRLGQHGGLTQFGANLAKLSPGARSSLRHWHEQEEEFVMITQGTCTLIDDSGPHAMTPGDIATFKAGEPNGHHFVNHTDAPAAFLVLGTKAPREVAHYSDYDLRLVIDPSNAMFTYRDGTPWEGVR